MLIECMELPRNVIMPMLSMWEAAQEADAVLLAVHWSRIVDVLNQTGDLSSKVIVICSLPTNNDNTELVVAHTSSGAEDLAKTIPRLGSCPHSPLFPAKCFRDVGFDPVNAGPLRIARYIEPFALLVAKLAYERNGGPEPAYRFERFRKYKNQIERHQVRE